MVRTPPLPYPISCGRATLASCGWLALALLGATTTACEGPAHSAATHAQAVPPPPPASAAAYVLDSVRLQRDDPASLLTAHVTYPRLRAGPGTAPADTAGLPAFNRAARTLALGLLKEIAATARENKASQLPSALRVSFRPYLLGQGLASVAFTVSQEGIGPRPITWATGLTYDVRSGRPLHPAALFAQSPAFKQVFIKSLQTTLAGSDDCELEPDNLSWDNFVLDAQAYYLLLGDAQVGRPCEVRQVRVPLARLRPFRQAASPLARLR